MSAGRTRAEAGFTLLETLIVLLLLGAGLYLVAGRGPLRSAGLDGQAAAVRIAGTLRTARAEAIARNRPVAVLFDPGANRFGLAGRTPTTLAPELLLRVAAPAGRSSIGFAPDGSSTGGEVAVVLPGGRRYVVTADWLTGRVALGAPP